MADSAARSVNSFYQDKNPMQADKAHSWRQQFKRKRLIFGAAFLVLALLVGGMLYNKIKNESIARLRAQHEEQITQTVIDLNRELGDMRNILRLLSSDSGIMESLSLSHLPDTVRISTIFRHFGSAVDHLLQVRWLNNSGYERVRVDIDHGNVQVAQGSILQDKSDRYYFQDAMQVLPPEIYFSPIDLNIENGEIIRPFQPVLRVGFQTTENHGMRPGLLLINYDLSALFEKIRTISTTDAEIMLVDAEGNWLLHPSMTLEWGTLLGQPQNSLKQTDPLLWKRISGQKNSLVQPYGKGLISSRLITLSNNTSPTLAANVYMVVRTPKDTVDDIEWAAIQPTLLLEIFILLIGGRILWRDFAMQDSLHSLTQTLEDEKYELQFLNDELDSSLSNQQLLQNELVETRKLSSLGIMVAGVAHELNTPIGGALISASSLQSLCSSLKKALDEGMTRQALENYLNSTREGLELVEQNLIKAANLVKSFKRLALDRSNEEVINFNLVEVVNDLLYSLSPRLKDSGTSIVNQIDTELTLTGYPGIISQILQNLIINAITYGTDGMQSGEIILQAERKEQWITLSVSDNGRGIAPELKDSLFDPFVTTGRGDGHTGLGLHLVHQWATNLMHGRINVESLDTGGTRFVIHFPQKIRPTTTHPAPDEVLHDKKTTNIHN